MTRAVLATRALEAYGARVVVYHESGHAVGGALLGIAIRCVWVRDGLGELGAVVTALRFREIDTVSLIRFRLAGGVAESRFTGVPPQLTDQDDEHIESLFAHARLIERWSHAQVRAAIDRERRQVERLVFGNWAWVARVAAVLEQRRYMTGADVLALRPAVF
ncbi:MAG: hypothetical protein QM736_29855 [Vicinamibacterales bacterium]